MSEQSAELATRLTNINADLIALLENCSPADWLAVCAGEQWPVCAVAHHIAVSERVIASWIRRVARGTAVPITHQMVDAGNAQEAAANARCDQQETIDLLRKHGAIALDTIRGLDDDQLATRAAMGPANGRELSAKQVIERVLFRHVEGHAASIHASIVVGTQDA
jgi:DinB superfamily